MSVTFLLAGSIRERVGNVEEVAGPMSIVIKPAGTMHGDEFGPLGARTIQVTLDPGEATCLDNVTAALRQWRWIHAGPAVPQFVALASAVRCERDADFQSLAADALAAIECEAPLVKTPPRWLRLIRERLDEETPRVEVREIAREAGVHPVYLARQFRRNFGCSITEYINRRRMLRIADRLTTSGVPVSRLAHEAGFADHAHLCRTFRNCAGVSPTAFRALATR